MSGKARHVRRNGLCQDQLVGQRRTRQQRASGLGQVADHGQGALFGYASRIEAPSDRTAQSVKCNLRGFSPAELTSHHEESEEMGGYFIINGNERIIRFLIVPRRNHVIGLYRTSFTARGSFYTPHACQIRCVRPDQSSQTNTLHYLGSGNITFRFSWRKNEYMVPVVMLLKALLDVSDKEIFYALAHNNHHDTFRTDRIELLLRGFKAFALPTGAQCLQFLGDKFRVVLGCPDDWDNTQVGRHLLARVVLVHLDAERDKFDLLVCASSFVGQSFPAELICRRSAVS